MTLTVAITGRSSIWVVADRRLSVGARPVTDTAHKVVDLQGTDGSAFISYAGLGRTIGGTEPSDWICRTLRGRQGEIEQHLNYLAQAFQRKVTPHLLRMGGIGAQHVLVSAFVHGEPRLYSIRLETRDGVASHAYLREGFEVANGKRLPTRVAIAGSGLTAALTMKPRFREIFRAIKACERASVTPGLVAKLLRDINLDVADQVSSVGPNCVVAWKFSPRLRREAGGNQFFSGQGVEQGEILPMTGGRVTRDFIKEMAKYWEPRLAAQLGLRDHELEALNGKPVDMDDDLKRIFELLDRGPDETLR